MTRVEQRNGIVCEMKREVGRVVGEGRHQWWKLLARRFQVFCGVPLNSHSIQQLQKLWYVSCNFDEIKPNLYGSHMGIIFIWKTKWCVSSWIQGCTTVVSATWGLGELTLEDYLRPGVLETSLSNTLRLQLKQKEGWGGQWPWSKSINSVGILELLYPLC